VEKVVQLLEELKSRVTQDGEKEQKIYDKFACWCEEITSKKALTINDMKQELRALGNKILELKGHIVTKISEIAEDMESIRKNEEQQQMAVSIRQKESAAFLSEKTELEQALSALEKAITILDAATAPAAMSLSQKADLLHTALLEAHAVVVRLAPGSRKSKAQLAALSEAVQGKSSYTPQSGTVQGILQDMYRSFSETLQTRIRDEATAHRNHEDLMATWQTEVIALQERVKKNEKAKAEAEMMLADAETGYAGLETQLPKDVAFFDATVASCKDKTQEWAQRKQLRESELEGITQALNIMSAPEANEIFSKAIKPGLEMGSFLQLRASPTRARKAVTKPPAPQQKVPLALVRAREVLQARARQSHSLRLAALAASMHRAGDVGHFDTVIEAIDALLVSLTKEQAVDDQKAVDCKDQYQSLALSIQDLEWKIVNNKAELEKLGIYKEEKEAEEAKTIEALVEVDQTMVDMKATREQENADFLQAKEEDQKAIALLEQAVDALETYYATKNNTSLLDAGVHGPEEPSEVAPDAEFSDKLHRKTEAKSIVGLLETLIEDLTAEIKNGQKAEEVAHLAYEDQLKAALELQASLNATKINLEETIALTSEKITEEETAQANNEAELGSQAKTKEDITPACDRITIGLEERRKKRKIEADGLVSAKEFLAGARPAVLVQQGAPRPVASGGGDESTSSSLRSHRAVSLSQRGQRS
jgi:hypothetical protein